jgi:hypothetical protein
MCGALKTVEVVHEHEHACKTGHTLKLQKAGKREKRQD